MTAVVGLSDLIVVQSGNAILVVRKDQAQRVREVVAALEVEARPLFIVAMQT